MNAPAMPVLVALALAAAYGAGGTPEHPSASRLPPQRQTVEALLAEATAANRAYQYERALELAEQAVTLEPLNLEANLMLRSAHARLGTMESAIGRFRMLQQHYPDSPIPYYLLGTTSIGGATASAQRRANLLEALRIDPSFAPAVAALSSMSLADGNDEAAEQWAQRAMELEPGPESTLQYAVLLRRQARYAEAIGLLQQLVAQYPDHLPGWIRLWDAQLAAESGQRGRAAMMMISRGDITPLLPQIEANRFRFMGSLADMESLANFLGRGGEAGRPLAAELWLAIAERYPDHPRAELALVTAAGYVETGAGIEILQRFLELYPSSPIRYRAYADMIMALIGLDRTDEAIALSREVIELPDTGFEEVGAGRATAARPSLYGRSFVCIGHSGWFNAAQSRVLAVGVMGFSGTGGRTYPVVMGGPSTANISVDPRAAAAAQSLLASACREPGVLMFPGMSLAQNPSYRNLGLALLERAVALHEDDVATGVLGGPDAERLEGHVDGVRGQLAGYYMMEGRLDDAVALIDEVVAGYDGGRANIDRIAAEIYDAAGRLEDAKVHYLRIVSSTSRDPTARDALDRIYGELSSDKIETFEPETAAHLPVRAVRPQRLPPLEIDMPLARLLESELTLMVIWTPRFDPTRAHLGALIELGETFADRGVGTQSLAVASSRQMALRDLGHMPAPAEPMLATFGDLAALGITELPTTLLVDSSGRVLARQMSYGVDAETWAEQWRAVVEAALQRR